MFFAPIPALVAPLRLDNPVQRAGNYQVELRLPADGVYAGEGVDVHIRVTDQSKSDPVDGAPGVIRAKVRAVWTMPAMASMPASLAQVHGEGIPGEYGLVSYFAHGGDYKLTLTVTPPGDGKPFTVTFPVAVGDEDARKSRKPAPKPYSLSVKTDARPTAGQDVGLSLTVIERATGKAIERFETVHEKEMHLIVVSDDLSTFFHEHPTHEAGGAFQLRFAFPTGGVWRVFADVAPKDAGSQVLPQTVSVDGPKAARVPLVPQEKPGGAADGLRLSLRPQPLVAGRSLTLTFDLKSDSGAPVTDLEPWLGAIAHLMLIDASASALVHSHPDESDPKNGRNGTLSFLARFPKPGIYKGWVQCQRAGKVVTLPFAVRAEAAK